jgi:O-antigen/teichoic acid export membrane protein
MNRKFETNVMWRIILSLPIKFTGLISLPILTNLYSKEEYAAWAQIIVITTMLKFLLCLRFEVTLVRFLKGDPDQPVMVRSVLTATLVTSSLFLAVTTIFQGPLAYILFKSGKFSGFLVWSALWISIKSFLEVAYAVLKADEKFIRVSLWQLGAALWQISAAAVAFFLHLPLVRLVNIAIAGHMVILVALLITCKYRVPFRGPVKSFRYLKKFFPFAWPLGVDNILNGIIKSADYFLIIHLISLADLGAYHVTVLLTGFLAVVITPVHFVLLPSLSRLWNTGKKEEAGHYFEMAFITNLKLGIPIIVGITLLYPAILRYVTPASYTIAASTVFLVALATLLLMIYFNHLYVIHMQEKTYLLPLLSIAAASMTFILGFVLVPRFGVTGAALTRLVVAAVMAVSVTIFARKTVYYSFPVAAVLKILFSSAVMGLVLYFMPRATFSWLVASAATGCIIYILLMMATGLLKKPHFKNTQTG